MNQKVRGADAPAKRDAKPDTAPAPSMRYGIYALAVLVLVNMFALADRHILSVLIEDIKADLGLSDAEIGFVYGTAISVFYVIFSIPLGRLADVWSRTNLLAVCVAAWSVMIFLTGTARNFFSFAAFRAGVGIGEAGCYPAVMSLVSDYFPPRLRSTAMSIAVAGVPLGSGLGLLLGGVILDAWNGAYPDPAAAPLGLRGWQVAFFAVAIPGPFLALWLWTLKEPLRGQSEGLAERLTMQVQPRPLPALWRELQATLPIVSLLPMLRRPDASRTIGINAVIGVVIAGLAAILIAATGSWAQWSALGLGAYCVASWMQNIALRDPATFAMVLKCRSLVFTNLGTAFYIFVIAGIGGWIVPFMIRVHGASAAEAGAVIGVFTALCGVIANVGGGIIADRLEKHTKRARAYVLLGSLVLALPLIVSMLYAPSKTEAYILFGLFFLTATVWFGVGPSVVNSLVLPRMRGITTALYFIVVTLLGVALGPYVMGYVSDLFSAGGASPGEALRQGILSGVTMLAPAAVLLMLAAVYLPHDEATRLDRARALGEPV